MGRSIKKRLIFYSFEKKFIEFQKKSCKGEKETNNILGVRVTIATHKVS